MESQLCLSIKRVPGADVGAFPLQLSFKISWKVYNYAANSNSEQIFEDSWVGLVGLGCSQYRLVVSLTFATFPIAEGLLYQRAFSVSVTLVRSSAIVGLSPASISRPILDITVSADSTKR